MLPIGPEIRVKAQACSQASVPDWEPLGDRALEWRSRISALSRDGYTGPISLETRWHGSADRLLNASRICGRKLPPFVRT